jgi:hypothetical protein
MLPARASLLREAAAIWLAVMLSPHFGVCVFAEGGNYFFENMVSNAIIGFDLSGTDKYRFNTTFNCTAPFDGGTAVNAENN